MRGLSPPNERLSSDGTRVYVVVRGRSRDRESLAACWSVGDDVLVQKVTHSANQAFCAASSSKSRIHLLSGRTYLRGISTCADCS